jgi:tRNA nucleotidyltransferase (CCA-adding enzyme)
MTINDTSFGVVPFHNDDEGNVFFCIVHHSGSHWGFPKGHPEEGERELETALRELKEETGITEVKIVGDLKLSESYSFEENNVTYNKTVTYFVGSTTNMNNNTPENFKQEIPEIKWASYEETMSMLTFDKAKAILAKVFQHLKN